VRVCVCVRACMRRVGLVVRPLFVFGDVQFVSLTLIQKLQLPFEELWHCLHDAGMVLPQDCRLQPLLRSFVGCVHVIRPEALTPLFIPSTARGSSSMPSSCLHFKAAKLWCWDT